MVCPWLPSPRCNATSAPARPNRAPLSTPHRAAGRRWLRWLDLRCGPRLSSCAPRRLSLASCPLPARPAVPLKGHNPNPRKTRRALRANWERGVTYLTTLATCGNRKGKRAGRSIPPARSRRSEAWTGKMRRRQPPRQQPPPEGLHAEPRNRPQVKGSSRAPTLKTPTHQGSLDICPSMRPMEHLSRRLLWGFEVLGAPPQRQRLSPP